WVGGVDQRKMKDRVMAVVFGAAVLFAAAVATGTLAAQPPRPHAVPQVGGRCPVGFQPSTGACIPFPGGRCDAFLKPKGVCPIGYTLCGKNCRKTGCDPR